MTGAGVRGQGLREAAFSFFFFFFLPIFCLLPEMRKNSATVWTGGASERRAAVRGARRRLGHDPVRLLARPAWTHLTVGRLGKKLTLRSRCGRGGCGCGCGSGQEVDDNDQSEGAATLSGSRPAAHFLLQPVLF